MKKRITIFTMVLIAIFTLTACQKATPTPTPPAGSPAAQATTEKAVTPTPTATGKHKGKFWPDYPYFEFNKPPVKEYEELLKDYWTILKGWATVTEGEEYDYREDIIGKWEEKGARPNMRSLLNQLRPADNRSWHWIFIAEYAFKDLNSDGVLELLLFGRLGLCGIYTLEKGRPVLLGVYWERNACNIGEDGLLYIDGSNGADDNSEAIYRIAKESAKLELVFEVGIEPLEEYPYGRHYKIVDGMKTFISQEESHAESKRFYEQVENTLTRKGEGFEETTLFTGELESYG